MKFRDSPKKKEEKRKEGKGEEIINSCKINERFLKETKLYFKKGLVSENMLCED